VHPPIALIVVPFLVARVGAAVDLDHESNLVAIEIGDVWPKRMLTPELQPEELSRSKMLPKNALGRGCVLAKIAGAFG